MCTVGGVATMLNRPPQLKGAPMGNRWSRAGGRRGILVLVSLFLAATVAHGEALSLPGIDIQLREAAGKPQEVATVIKLLALLTVLSLAPAILIVMTSFTRIIVVLSMLRHAIGMQDTPPNTVLLSLARIFTMFSMAPVFDQANELALAPYLKGTLTTEAALTAALKTAREFMIRQTREADIRL